MRVPYPALLGTTPHGASPRKPPLSHGAAPHEPARWAQGPRPPPRTLMGLILLAARRPSVASTASRLSPRDEEPPASSCRPRCAFKCCEAIVNGEARYVYKDPVTDKGTAPRVEAVPAPAARTRSAPASRAGPWARGRAPGGSRGGLGRARHAPPPQRGMMGPWLRDLGSPT